MSTSPSEPSEQPGLTARLAAEDGAGPTAHPELVLRCRQRSLEIWIDTKVAASLVGTRVRWDDAPAEHYDVWSEPQSPPERLVTPEPEDFLRKAMKARRMRFEFRARDGWSATATFRLAGISSVMLRLQEACPALRSVD